jgi:hypothetical protein
MNLAYQSILPLPSFVFDEYEKSKKKKNLKKLISQSSLGFVNTNKEQKSKAK